jgi:hypothetical protein
MDKSMIVSFETDTASLMLLIHSSARLSNDLTNQLFSHETLCDLELVSKKQEVGIITSKIKRLSVLIIAMIDALNSTDESLDLFDDVKEKALLNLTSANCLLSLLREN